MLLIRYLLKSTSNEIDKIFISFKIGVENTYQQILDQYSHDSRNFQIYSRDHYLLNWKNAILKSILSVIKDIYLKLFYVMDL